MLMKYSTPPVHVPSSSNTVSSVILAPFCSSPVGQTMTLPQQLVDKERLIVSNPSWAFNQAKLKPTLIILDGPNPISIPNLPFHLILTHSHSLELPTISFTSRTDQDGEAYLERGHDVQQGSGAQVPA